MTIGAEIDHCEDVLTAQPAFLGRRDLFRPGLGLMVATGAAGCANNGGSAGSGTLIGPNSPKVAAAECARQVAGARRTSIKLAVVQAEVDLGGITANTWSYGELPGKEIRIRRGDLLNVELRNQLPQPTSIHWHASHFATTWTACRTSLRVRSCLVIPSS